MLCEVHCQHCVSTIIRIPDEKCLTNQNLDSSERVQNVQKYTRSRKFVGLIEIRPYQGPTYQDTPVL